MPAQACGGFANSQGDEAIRVTIAALVALSALALPGSGVAAIEAPAAKVAPDNRCPYARLGVAYYRGHFVRHQLRRGASIPSWRKPRNCADARYLAFVWSKRAYAARMRTREHLRKLAERTLRDFDVRPGYSGWRMAVREVQRAYPGTDAWLLSCSASEGGWGRWVGYSGVPYSASLIDSDTVGGWLQFRPSTFSGFNRRAIEDVRSRGFIVPESASSWLSPLGQALAGAWGISNGMRSHWAGHGCH
jgi:hypothetical protein